MVHLIPKIHKELYYVQILQICSDTHILQVLAYENVLTFNIRYILNKKDSKNYFKKNSEKFKHVNYLKLIIKVSKKNSK